MVKSLSIIFFTANIRDEENTSKKATVKKLTENSAENNNELKPLDNKKDGGPSSSKGNGRKKRNKLPKPDVANGVNAKSTTIETNGISNKHSATNKTVPMANKTAEMLQTIPNEIVNNNLDNVLKTVTQLDNTCDFTRCRVKTSLIGQDCKLCHQRFCMKHQLPEVHGCGGAIKKSERSEFLRPRQMLPISAALRRNEQKDAHTRLEQKLKEMSLARQKKGKVN